MAVSLEQAKLDATDAIQAGIIDEFRKSSAVLDAIEFDDAASPGTGSGTLVYGYQRLINQPTANFRAYNAEYQAQEVEKQRVIVELKPFGGRYGIDRVFARMGNLVDEVALQASQKVKAAGALFNWTFINGDTDASTGLGQNGYDGIDKAVTGTVTETDPSIAIDLSTPTAIEANGLALVHRLNKWLRQFDAAPHMLLGNESVISALETVALTLGYRTESEDAFGRAVIGYRGIPLIDLQTAPGSNTPVAPLVTRTVELDGEVAAETGGLADLYAVRYGLDGVHGVSQAGAPLVWQVTPEFDRAGAVQDGEVEMVAALAVKNTRSAGVFRSLKVEP